MSLYSRGEQPWCSHILRDMLGFRVNRTANQEVGVEIEVEGLRLPSAVGDGDGWTVTRDGSLRGESFEYIFNGPKPRKNVTKLLTQLWGAFTANNSVLNTSYRTSVHVHLNFQHKTMLDMYNMYCAYTLFEDILMEFCGAGRKGNLFCLRTKDARFLHNSMYRNLKRKRIENFNDSIRYAAINFNALMKYGSIEFRAMRGLTEAEPVDRWVSILLDLYDYACSGTVIPREMVEGQSMYGVEFISQVFSIPNAAVLMEGMTHGEISEHLYNGSRRIQDLAYDFDEEFMAARDWLRDNPKTKDEPKKVKSSKLSDFYTSNPAGEMPTISRSPTMAFTPSIAGTDWLSVALSAAPTPTNREYTELERRSYREKRVNYEQALANISSGTMRDAYRRAIADSDNTHGERLAEHERWLTDLGNELEVNEENNESFEPEYDPDEDL